MHSRLADYLANKYRIDAHYFLKGGFWLTFTQAVVILTGLLVTALFAHILTETDYGSYRYLIGLAIIFSSFSLTGLGEAILQATAKKHFHFYRETTVLNFLYSLPVVIIGLGGSLYYWLNGNTTLGAGCLFIAILQPIINTFQYTPAFLQGSKRFAASTVVQSLRTILVAASTSAALFFTQSVLTIFLTFLVSSVLINIVFYLLYNIAVSARTPDKIRKQYLTYAKNTSFRNFISAIGFRLDTVILFTRFSAIELAVFTIATIIPEQIKATFKSLASLVLPKYAVHPNPEMIKKGIPRRSIQLFLVLCLVTAGYILAAPYIYELFFPKYSEAVIYSQLFALSFPAYAYYVPLTLFMAKLDEKKLNDFHIHTGILQIIIALLLVYPFGIIGAIIARLGIQYLRMMYCFWLTYK